MEELFRQITGVVSLIVLIALFGPIILFGIIQFLLTFFAVIFNFILCIFNPKYLIDFYASTKDSDYE